MFYIWETQKYSTMIDFPFLYRATVFTYTIKPETENIRRVQHLFEDKGLLPSMFQELVNGSPIMRFEMIVPNGDWRIRFLEQRIDIVKSVDFNDVTKMVKEHDFCSLVIDCFFRIMNEFGYKAFRLAFSGIYVLKDCDFQIVYNKLIRPCELFEKEKPKEWNFRNVFRFTKSINGNLNTLNYCFDANIGVVESTLPTLFKSERIIFNTDINTLQEETIDYKYTQEDVSDFFKNISFWNEEVKDSYCKLLS